ncbi:hypothetical protein [Mycobacterium sp. JS623]|uniref:hypothetical protein n=1 Tax=Mycobacterium sp. JS623 TaxID=212767 RepID=UPI001E5B5E2B|nr:hypothetical protein [Mycobacterium sp. JS623]
MASTCQESANVDHATSLIHGMLGGRLPKAAAGGPIQIHTNGDSSNTGNTGTLIPVGTWGWVGV